MRTALIAFTLLAASGCATQRYLIQAQYVDNADPDHLYFVEQEAGKDSRIKRCQINADNSVTCATQYDLD